MDHNLIVWRHGTKITKELKKDAADEL
jgi:hypothetical protein